MDLQKINVKFFCRYGSEMPLSDFIPIFHSWIQNTDGDYFDVADYSHVDAGPGILLIAHDANISLDERDRRRGLLFNQKQPLSGDNPRKLRHVLQQALRYCRKLEEEPSLAGKVEFRGNEVEIVVNDRLRAPNCEETLEELRDDLETVGALLFGSTQFVVHHVDHADRRFTVRLESEVESSASALLMNASQGS